MANGEPLSIAGYGALRVDDLISNESLYSLDATIKEWDLSVSEFLVDEGPGRGACFGDSGGPAYARDHSGGLMLIGVDSFQVSQESECGGVEAYSKVSAARPWIDEIRALTTNQ